MMLPWSGQVRTGSCARMAPGTLVGMQAFITFDVPQHRMFHYIGCSITLAAHAGAVMGAVNDFALRNSLPVAVT